LSNPERVSEPTRARVAEAVLHTGYTMNQVARSLRMRAARTILIALPNIGNPFYSTILEAAVLEASSRGYGLLVASPFRGDVNRWVADYFTSNRVDGLLLFDGSLDTRALHGLLVNGGRLPLVVAYDELPDPLVNSVMTDNLQAAERAVGYLLSLGHRKIGHVVGHSRNKLPNERLVGFRSAMTEAGIPVRPEWVIQGDYSMRSGYTAAKAFLELDERPTAVFSGNDEMAIGLISGLREGGLECPRDVSIIGFDDIAVAAHFVPPLTTMRQPRDQIGRRAAEVLIDILERDPHDRGPVRMVLNSELVVRQSTRRIA
jgi:LacI family repressor for deo operon, udp, cdd, tsx, nupC, and nupG